MTPLTFEISALAHPGSAFTLSVFLVTMSSSDNQGNVVELIFVTLCITVMSRRFSM